MNTLKTIISSFHRMSLQIHKPRIDQCLCLGQNVFNSTYSRNFSSPIQIVSQNLLQRNEVLSLHNKLKFTPMSTTTSLNECSPTYNSWEKRINFLKLHRKGPVNRTRKKKNPLGYDKPFAKGVILKTFVKKPRKPNSANRKCVLLRLSTGKEISAYVPGEGHNLQEHNIVLVRVGRLRDVPGVKLRCVRGAYDLGHVIKRKKA